MSESSILLFSLSARDDEEQLQTFFTSIVLLPVLFIAGLIVLYSLPAC